METKVKQFLYAVHDIKAGNYYPPLVAANAMVAARDFQTRVREENSLLNKFPEDFDLVEVGVWDMETGIITPTQAPIVVVTATQMLAHEAR